jgi:hypothetical protein
MQVYVLYEPKKYFSNANVQYNTLKNIKIRFWKKETISSRKNKEDSKRNETSANLSLQSIRIPSSGLGPEVISLQIKLTGKGGSAQRGS